MRPSARFLKDFLKQEVPSGTINGSNTAFNLSQVPDEVDSILVFLNGLLQQQTTDYTVSGQTITFVTAPANGQDLVCYYVSKDGE